VRWGLIFVTVLVGVVALSTGLGWYFDPKRQPDRAFTVPPATSTQRVNARNARHLALPEATREELALLDSSDSGNQLRGAELLRGRAVTPEVMTAVEAALSRTSSPELEARLICLESRFERPGMIEILLARFPKEGTEVAWNLKPELSCVLDALVNRTLEAPERVRAALMPALYSGNASVRERALAAFRMMDLPQIPPALLVEASTRGAAHQREALSGAVALGAVRHNPTLVANAIRDADMRHVVKEELRSSPHANAARIVANVWAERPDDSNYERLARDRELQLHDVSAALLEIVMDPPAPDGKRAAAAHQLELLKDVGPLHDLRELSPTLDPGPLKTAVESTIQTLEARLKSGRRSEMRTLPR
jgi:hypothetical protein